MPEVFIVIFYALLLFISAIIIGALLLNVGEHHFLNRISKDE